MKKIFLVLVLSLFSLSMMSQQFVRLRDFDELMKKYLVANNYNPAPPPVNVQVPTKTYLARLNDTTGVVDTVVPLLIYNTMGTDFKLYGDGNGRYVLRADSPVLIPGNTVITMNNVMYQQIIDWAYTGSPTDIEINTYSVNTQTWEWMLDAAVLEDIIIKIEVFQPK